MNIEKKILHNEWVVPESIKKYYNQYHNKENMKEYKNNNVKFKIPKKYEIMDQVGRGSYGIVFACINKETKEHVAIKRIEKAFEHKIFAKRTLRELRIMRLLKHENILDIIEIILPDSRENFEDILVVTQLIETDLSSVIKTPQKLENELIRFIIYQLLRGIKYQNSASIIHRDLKPRNLLVSTNCDLKICDYGLSRFVNKNLNKQSNILTDYVATRWYRAPELLIGQEFYDISVDIWSVGCILAELINRKPLLVSSDWKAQLILILEFLNGTDNTELDFIDNPSAVEFIKNYTVKSETSINDLIKTNDKEAIDLLKKMLTFSPDKRIKLDDALNHPFIKKFHQEEDEPITKPLNKMHFEFENYELTTEQLKDLIYEEILLYHFPEKLEDYNNKINNNESTLNFVLNNDNKHFIDKSDSEDEN